MFIKEENVIDFVENVIIIYLVYVYFFQKIKVLKVFKEVDFFVDVIILFLLKLN